MSISGLPTASATVLGAIKVGAGLSITAGVLAATGSPSPATTAALGSVIVPTAGNLTVDGSGNIGVPVAAAGTLGVVRVGTGLAIDGSGILSATGGTPPLATTTTAGTVIVPTAGNLTVDGSGNIGAPVAAAGTLGVVRVGSGLAIDGSGILSATGGSSMAWSAISSDTGAVVNNGYMVDTSGGPVVLTLPAAPASGESVGWLDGAGTFDTTNKLTFARNGLNIMGQAQNMDVTTQYAGGTLIYNGATLGWRIA
jgi:hypothetical protein